jgi:hypothetical protein
MANDKRAALLANLQTAFELEWSTIPPYMVAILSMKLTANRDVANLVRGVMMEEMLHMALIANVMNAVGGTIHIDRDNMPSYPRPLFRGRDVAMNLAPFSAETVSAFMRFEEPQTSIGEFYRGVIALLEELDAAGPGTLFTGDPARQLEENYYWGAGNQIIVVKDLDTARRALTIVMGKGEGAGEHPPFTPGDPLAMAHYYRFAEIHYQRRYVVADDPQKPPTGEPLPVDYSAVHPIKINPKNYAPGSKLANLNDAFNSRYTMMLRQLRQAVTGAPQVLYTAIMNGMHGSMSTALEMMTTPIAGDREGRTGCPTFEWLEKAEAAS